jgi:hypothetical protein
MNVIGDLGQYQRYQLGQSMPIAAASGGGPGDMLGIGMGLAMTGGLAAGVQQPGLAAAPAALTPPPLPAAASFHVAIGGQSQGPYTAAQVASALAAGQITPETLVWTAGMASWAAAATVPQIAAASGPPPLPPAAPPADGGQGDGGQGDGGDDGAGAA